MSSRRVIHVGAWCGALGVIASLYGCSANDEADGSTGRSGTPGGAAPPDLAAQTAKVRTTFPHARVQLQGNRLQRLYGAIATGKNSAAAAESVWRSSAELFGVAPGELVPATRLGSNNSLRTARANPNGVGLMLDRATGKHKFRLFNYRQERDGIPVFRAGLRTLVRDAGAHPVVWANANLKRMGNFRARPRAATRVVDLDKSLRAVGSSRVDLQACKLEYSIVSPK